jgi:polygalacturonase
MTAFKLRILTGSTWVLPLVLLAAACNGRNAAPTVFQVGTTTADPQLPAEPQLPTDAQVCATVIASNSLVVRPDGALPPEADPSTTALPKDPDPTNAIPWALRGPATLYGVDMTDNPHWYNPDQARIQQALNDCGAAVDAQVGAAISAADGTAGASGVSGEELAKPAYKPTTFAVHLVVNGGGGNAFISGPLWLPSGVTLWIDSGATLFASRDVMA